MSQGKRKKNEAVICSENPSKKSGLPMAKGFGEASISLKKSSKSSSLMAAIDCEQIQKQLVVHFENLYHFLKIAR